jgi:prophage regulatory protein
MHKLPETGFLRLQQIIGDEGLTEAQADANEQRNRIAKAAAEKSGRLDESGKPIYSRRPTRPRPAAPGLIPVKKSCWWDGVRTGRFPKPVKLGLRVTAWRVEQIRELIDSIGGGMR